MEDAEIIALLEQRRESALDEIMHRYGRMLKSLARHILPTAQDAEECINDALLDIWNTIPPKCPKSVAAYTAMLTRRRAVDRLRRMTAKKRGGGVYQVVLNELEDAQNGSFHTWFLPWFFYIEGDGKVICQSEYTRGLHTQIYPDDTEDDFSGTFLYCIDLCDIDGKSLVGKELTVRLLYAEDEYMFNLSDDLGNDYSVFPYEDEDTNGYWFTKPDTVGTQLTLKIVRSQLASDSFGHITDDSYEVLCEIPIELKTPLWERFR